MQHATLKCLGVGDGCPSAERNHSAFLYGFGNDAFLLDCGEPLSRSYKASGLSYDLADRLLLSHMHFDHVGGFGMWIQSCWLEGRTKPLTVNGPASGLNALHELLRAGCLFDEVLPFPLQFEPWRVGQAVSFGETRVTPFATSHLSSCQERFEAEYPGRFEAFCFKIEGGAKRVAHSADIGAIDDLAPLVEEPLDLLVCELAHVAPDRLFQFLQSRKIRKFCFVHLSRVLHGRLSEIRELAGKVLGADRVVFPSDGDEVAV